MEPNSIAILRIHPPCPSTSLGLDKSQRRSLSHGSHPSLLTTAPGAQRPRPEAFDLSHCVLSTRKTRLPDPWGPLCPFLMITRGAPLTGFFLSRR